MGNAGGVALRGIALFRCIAGYRIARFFAGDDSGG